MINNGSRPLLGSTVELTFLGHDRKAVGNVVKPLQGMVAPSQTRPFRITVDNVPAGWNHLMPTMTGLTVAAD